MCPRHAGQFCSKQQAVARQISKSAFQVPIQLPATISRHPRTIHVTFDMNNLGYHGLPVPVPVPYTLPYPIVDGPLVPTACTHTSYPRPDDFSSGPLTTGRSRIRTINRKTASLFDVVLLGLKRNAVRTAHSLEDCGQDYIDTLRSLKTATVARKELHL
jgi:hypothetical protein